MCCGKRSLMLMLALLLTGFTYLGFSANSSNLPQGFSQAAEKAHPIRNVKPLVVGIHADWCPGCKNIEPAMMRLMHDYEGKVEFVTLDVTDAKSSRDAAQKANTLGLSKWFELNKTRTSTVAVIDPESKHVIKTFMNNPDASAYAAVLKQLVNQ